MGTMSSLITLVVLGVILLVAWSNSQARKDHANFRPVDVEMALQEVLSNESCCHDGFDLFLSWPIDDPYLESLRQRTLTILNDSPPPPAGYDISPEGLKQIELLLMELRSRM